ncbi:MAG: CmpA/NrtA family ABC transporter substrate-binding protein [Hyphomicrobiaceae bacterium]
MSRGTMPTVHAGYMPLLDCAPLVVAATEGFAEAEGVHLAITRESSWATVRDKLAVHHLDVAHVLAPMPIASNLELAPLNTPLVVPISLGFGGNTVTVSRALWRQLADLGAPSDFDAAATAAAMAALVAARRRKGEAPLVIAVVHTHSAHHYELAYWLATVGLIPGRDYEIMVVPPQLSAAALAAGHVDGFCAGEPWGSVAVAEGVGAIVTTKPNIWRSSPEKVLGVRADWADANPDTLDRLVRAVYRAAQWCDEPANRPRLAALMSGPEYLAQPVERLLPALTRALVAADGTIRGVPDLLTFSARAANFPWHSHALWLYTQMVRWHHAPLTRAAFATARDTYRPDLNRRALTPLGAPLPSANSKIEGALAVETPVGSASGRLTLGPDGAFDGQLFDPDHALDYLASLGFAMPD